MLCTNQVFFVCSITSTTVIAELKNNRVSGSSKLNSKHIRDFLFSLLERGIKLNAPTSLSALRCLGDVHLASSDPSSAMRCYLEYLALCTDYFEKHHVPQWGDAGLFKRMIKCCEMLGCFTEVSKIVNASGIRKIINCMLIKTKIVL